MSDGRRSKLLLLIKEAGEFKEPRIKLATSAFQKFVLLIFSYGYLLLFKATT